MKTNRVLSLALALAIIIGLFAMPASASEEKSTEEIEIIIENESISAETKARIIAYYSNPEAQDDGATAYGLTCTLFGHKLESSTIETITHKARSSAPRCLQKTYNHQSCTRCDYEESTLLGSTYIHCCS